MSDVLAVAAVTKALLNLMVDAVAAYVTETGDAEIGDPAFTSKALDKARSTDGTSQLNLFLYQITPNPSWQNTALPAYSNSGALVPSPLALTLHYMVTAYGSGDDEVLAHRLLGIAMRAFFDHPKLSPKLIEDALPESNLSEQLEPVRLTYFPMPLDETSKLWSTLQIGYRPSATYEVSVVLIDGERRTRAALPVLSRRPSALGSAAPPFPTLTGLDLGNVPSAELERTIALSGHRLDTGAEAVVSLTNIRLKRAIEREVEELRPQRRTPRRLEFVLTDPERWPAGPYVVTAKFRHPAEPERTTNALSFMLAPKIMDLAYERTGEGATIAVEFRPHVWPSQRVSLLLGDREIIAPEIDGPTDALVFNVEHLAPGAYFVRLRVDGVDSLLVDPSGDLSTFDDRLRVEVT